MIQNLLKYGLIFIGVMLLQVLVVNNITLFYLVHPYVYFMLLLVLPVSISNWLLLLIGFFVGIVMDMFASTPGLHASACVFIAFARPLIVRMFRPRTINEEDQDPHIHSFGLGNFVLYALVLTFLHHLFLHIVEVFEFAELDKTLFRVALNTIASLGLILVIELLVLVRNQSD